MSKTRYVACNFCGKTVSERRFVAAPFDITPSEYRILQVRQQVGGRKGQGFFDIPEEGKNIVQMLNDGDPREREIAEALIERVLNVVRDYMEAGIITREEI